MSPFSFSYRSRAFALRKGGAAPEIAFGRLPPAHGLAALRAFGGRPGVALTLAGLDAPGHEPFAEPPSLLEGFALSRDLALEHIQRAANDDEHGVGHQHRIVGVKPAGVFPALFQCMLRRLVDHVVRKRRVVERDRVDRPGFGGMHRPRKLTAVEDEHLVVAAQFAQARPRYVGQLHLRVFGGRRTFRALDDVLPPAARRLGHLVVLAALRVVKFDARFAVVEGQETAAEAQRVELHDRGQRERMQPTKAPVLVEELRHCGLLGLGMTSLPALTSLTNRSIPSPWSIGSFPSFLSTMSSHNSPENAWCSSDFFNASSAACFRS